MPAAAWLSRLTTTKIYITVLNHVTLMSPYPDSDVSSDSLLLKISTNMPIQSVCSSLSLGYAQVPHLPLLANVLLFSSFSSASPSSVILLVGTCSSQTVCATLPSFPLLKFFEVQSRHPTALGFGSLP